MSDSSKSAWASYLVIGLALNTVGISLIALSTRLELSTPLLVISGLLMLTGISLLIKAVLLSGSSNT